MGIDRQRIVDTFYPEGSEVASALHAVRHPQRLRRRRVVRVRCRRRPRRCWPRPASRTASRPRSTTATSFGRTSAEVGRVVEDIQAQLKENLNIDAEIVVMESGAFIEASTGGQLDGHLPAGLGRRLPAHHELPRLPLRRGQSAVRRRRIRRSTKLLQQASRSPIRPKRSRSTSRPTTPSRTWSRWCRSRTAARQRPTVPMSPNPQASPLTEERFALSGSGAGDTFVWMQNAEPISLFCADESDGESLRGCAQIIEGLFAYELNGTDTEPALAESCDPSDDLTVWTCHAAPGRDVPRRNAVRRQ